MHRLSLERFLLPVIVIGLISVSKIHLNKGEERANLPFQLFTGETASVVFSDTTTSFVPTFLVPVSAELESSLASPPPAPSRSVPQIQAVSAMVLDLESGAVLFELNPQTLWPIASLTKLMTVAVLTDNLDLTRSITITEADVLTEGTAGNFKAGEIFSGEDLLKAALMLSSNDAIAALTSVYGREQLLLAMNRKAEEWGMRQTRFDDTTGLSALNQSTAPDLSVFMRQMYERYPGLLTISRLPEASVTELGQKKSRRILNINRLAGRPEFLGGKTGFTDVARENLLSLFTSKGHHVVIVVLGAEDRFLETKALYDYITSR